MKTYCIFEDDFENFMPTNETLKSKNAMEACGVMCLGVSEFFEQSNIESINPEDCVIVWIWLHDEQHQEILFNLDCRKFLKNIDTNKSDRILFNKERGILDRNVYEAVLLTYCSEKHSSFLKSIGQNVINFPHLIDFDDERFSSNEKKYDVIISGQISPKSYPVRTKIAEALMNNSEKYGVETIFLPHPGWRINELRHDYFGDKFVELLSLCHLTVTCTGGDDSMVMKYLESAKALSLPVGDAPSNMPQQAQNAFVKIEEDDDETIIMEKISKALSDKDALEKRRKAYHDSMKNNFNIEIKMKEILNKIREGNYD